MRIQNNIPAVNTHRYYNIANNAVASSAEKLSSGYRINRAGDDAAGLAISEKMRAQIRGLNMASKNSLDAISLVQTAEGALQSTHDILQRMRELAVQAASDTNEQVIDRGALDQEFQALKAEIDDIAQTTRFNDQNLIDGTFQKTRVYKDSTSTFKAGTTTGAVMSVMVDRAVAGTYTVKVTGNAPVAAQIISGAAASATAASSTALAAVTGTPTTGGINNFGTTTGVAFTGVQTNEHNGNTYTFVVDGQTADALNIKLVDTEGNTVSQILNFDGRGGGTFTLNFEGVGTYSFATGGSAVIEGNAEGRGAWQNLLSGKTLTFNHLGVTPGERPAVPGSIELDIDGDKVILYKGDTTATFKSTGIQLSFNAITDFDIASQTNAAAKFTAGTIVVKAIEGKSLIVQTGANEGDELGINIDAMNTGRLGIVFSNVATQENASKAITEVNDAINQVSTQRAALGALQNRLNFKIANLDIGAENLQAAESRIRDVDMAKEMTAFSKKNILTQAATAMLAQANSAPQNVLQLLR